MSETTIGSVDETVVVEQKPFEQSGEYEDEVTITFESDEKLYVSKAFLAHVSPVFKPMFQGNFVEAVSNRLDMKDLSKDDCLEFLLCCYPRTLKQLNINNALQVVRIAEKYDVQPLVTRCKQIMDDTLTESYRSSSTAFDGSHFAKVKICLQILQMANHLNFSEITDNAIERVSQFGSSIYLRDDFDNYFRGVIPKWGNMTAKGQQTLKECQNDCCSLFKNLPEETRFRIVKERLKFKEDNCVAGK